MATFKICVFKHQQRVDKKYPVSIRVTWKRKHSYIKSEFYVTDKQIVKKTFEVKDTYILNELNKRIMLYEELKSRKLGFRIELYSAKELTEYFQKETTPGTDHNIDFVAFSREHYGKLIAQGRKSTALTMQRSLNALIDFCNGRQKIAITEITAKFLAQFELFLRSERVVRRTNQLGRITTTINPGLSDVSVIDYMTDLRTLFNAAMDEFNDEDKEELRIIHYPFRKYKIQRTPEPKKRNLSAMHLHSISNASEEQLELERTIFSRDVFMLSFYLVGMNLADMYDLTNYANGRIQYSRRKTKNRRQDKAFISIKVEPEAAAIIEKYRDQTGQRVFSFYKRYSTSHVFSSNVNKGLKNVAKVCDIQEPISTYYARHSWATIARNDCGISKDDVAISLNHVNQFMKVTDGYLAKDWSMIDRANRAVIDYLNMPPSPINNQSADTPKSSTK